MPLDKLAAINPTKHAFSLMGEFKNFAFKGNVIDLAVGVIIGAAFGKIIDSLVKNVIMPVVSLAMPSDQGYKDWVFSANGTDVPYGLFLAEVVNFLVVALVLFFFLVTFLGWIIKAKTEEEAAPPPPT